MIREIIIAIVRGNGYGAWYQREAWETIKHWPMNMPFSDVLAYINQRYPKLGV